MKLRYLGTAAAEGFPALFCNCEYCAEARRLGGKNIRSRSQAIINDDLLIDFPPDCYYHFLNNNIEGDKIKHLLITHSHRDHLNASDLECRVRPFAHNMAVETLGIFCSAGTASVIGTAPRGTVVTVLEPFKPTSVGDYEVTSLPARHMPGGDAVIYIIKGDKTILYAHDTGFLFEENFEYIEKNGICFDMISLDCTNVEIPISDEGSHMGLENNRRVIERLKAIGAITDSTVKYVNHFSHNGNPIQHVLEKKASEIGCFVSYDGCEVEF